MKRILAASLMLAAAVSADALASSEAPARAGRPCERPDGRPVLFTVAQANRAARVIYAHELVSRRERRFLARLDRCQRNAGAIPFVRGYARRQRAAWRARTAFSSGVASWYYDGSIAYRRGGYPYGFATCGSGGGPCYPFGTRVEFCYRSCVIAVADDHGPYVAGRAFDLGEATAQATGVIGSGVATVRWRRR